MKAAGYRVVENDPFEGIEIPLGNRAPARAAAARRVTELWAGSAEAAAERFPDAPGRPNDIDAYLRRVEERYAEDAYHSLSIEGYRVTPALIERVRRGDWNPDASGEDRDHRNAPAARGYWEAFQLVKASIAEILRGAEAPDVVERDHLAWYRALFQPSVELGLIAPGSLAGYRRHPVYIKGSRHVPMRAERVDDAMAAMFASMRAERRPGVQAVLGHWLLGYIHPFPDGNGRTARFVMNALLAAGGYPWTVVRIEEGERYLAALDVASLSGDVTAFAHLLAELLVGQRNRTGDAA
jgi:fido (protein-threonine AMPylation protein)